MLKHQLIHPEINAILARAGHSSQVLIADGNYPASSAMGPKAQLVSLGLTPGVPTCLLYTSPSPRDQRGSRMPSSA